MDILIGAGGSTISDTDSLSSVDDSGQFKGSLRAAKKRMSSLTVPGGGGCSVSTTNSDVATLNATMSDVLNTTVGSRSCVGGRRDRLEASEVRDCLITVVYVLKNLGHDSLLGLLLNYEESEFVEFLSMLELCLKTFRYRGKANLHTLNAISKGVVELKSPRHGLEKGVVRHTSISTKLGGNEKSSSVNNEVGHCFLSLK